MQSSATRHRIIDGHRLIHSTRAPLWRVRGEAQWDIDPGACYGTLLLSRILVPHKGRLVEEGAHQDLLARGGYYHRLYQLQYQEQEVAG